MMPLHYVCIVELQTGQHHVSLSPANLERASNLPCSRKREMHTPGIEPGSQAWKACMTPLHYVCCCQHTSKFNLGQWAVSVGQHHHHVRSPGVCIRRASFSHRPVPILALSASAIEQVIRYPRSACWSLPALRPSLHHSWRQCRVRWFFCRCRRVLRYAVPFVLLPSPSVLLPLPPPSRHDDPSTLGILSSTSPSGRDVAPWWWHL